MSDTAEKSELFIGRFEIVNRHTKAPTGDEGYVALILGQDRVAQFRSPYYPTLRLLIDEIKSNTYWLSKADGRITFEPLTKTYEHEAKDLVVVTLPLTLDEINHVQVALGRC